MQIRLKLLAWYDSNHRILPWRRNKLSKVSVSLDDDYVSAPASLSQQEFIYYVWVSEVIIESPHSTSKTDLSKYYTLMKSSAGSSVSSHVDALDAARPIVLVLLDPLSYSCLMPNRAEERYIRQQAWSLRLDKVCFCSVLGKLLIFQTQCRLMQQCQKSTSFALRMALHQATSFQPNSCLTGDVSTDSSTKGCSIFCQVDQKVARCSGNCTLLPPRYQLQVGWTSFQDSSAD